VPPIFRRHLTPAALLTVLAVLLCGCVPLSNSTQPAAPTPQPTEPSLAPPVPHAYAALGASETYGVGARPFGKGYAYLVAHALRAHPFVDVGIPGTTLDQGYQTELTSALNIRPALCTVFFGVNDVRAGVSLSVFLRDLLDLTSTLRQAHARVLIIGMPDLSLLPATRKSNIGGLGQLSARWNHGMKRVARQTGSNFLDLAAYTRLIALHPLYISSDGLHPSNQGHAALARVVAQTIQNGSLWNAR